jgi:hypothetical protein
MIKIYFSYIYFLPTLEYSFRRACFYKVDIIIENSTLGLNYYGDYNLHLFDIKLKGIEKGIIETYMALLQTRNYI